MRYALSLLARRDHPCPLAWGCSIVIMQIRPRKERNCSDRPRAPGDGDCTYAVSTGKLKTDVPLAIIGTLAAEVVSMAFLRSAQKAISIEGWPASADFPR